MYDPDDGKKQAFDSVALLVAFFQQISIKTVQALSCLVIHLYF